MKNMHIIRDGVTLVSDRNIEKYLMERFPPKIIVDKFGHKRSAVWCIKCNSYLLGDRI